ncbi:MAG: hypothetical protein U0872_15780 [Planctomycetaceae bacterium]
MAVLLALLVMVTAYAWLFPVEYFQAWAVERAGPDPYRQFEAVGRAEAACWVIRLAGPIAGLLGVMTRRHSAEFCALAQSAALGFWQLTRAGRQSRRWSTWICRSLLIGWLIVAAGQWGQALNQRLTDWPYYRLRQGSDVLPNISDSNREVIRYVRETTPPDARILAVSDQKLFFLSYYLLPRRIYHRLHPDSEFVIPQPNQERRLAAYRVDELDPAWIRKLNPDYLLEYFEHPDSIDPSRAMPDKRWLEFLRQAHRDPLLIPAYDLKLQPLAQEPQP